MSFKVTFTAITMRDPRVFAGDVRNDLLFYTKDYCDDVIGKMLEGYNTPPKDSYTRTGRYGTYMVAKNTSSGGNIQYTITDPVQDPWGRYYANYVGGSGQASFHRGRWPTFKQVINRAVFTRGAQKIITKAIRRG